uniref:Uncharacterized protein n=1 Tax=Chromera velia CCMP2878 TaxID=1169474 RepID=A0A0G4HB82_9ALVE|eukprot:Cvel_6138.t1-p1 / transcript=Cvel_6138.t1 / gene=Cvel_6138 / organism=Chromera_velia_CCMP2878 / gene_product=Phospholipase B1, membrane-associated, putative / transcript_product=Phospholipase B1, membrane-associated, putative / location=Cvel_scaffold296:89098-93864(+) / protein_length=418 / sequence_SO=supercontig / SO=protein_coding / is_pseudo=false
MTRCKASLFSFFVFLGSLSISLGVWSGEETGEIVDDLYEHEGLLGGGLSTLSSEPPLSLLGSLPAPLPFNCTTEEMDSREGEAKDIHDLHPSDIKVVMALGDSVTAAFGMAGKSLNPFSEFGEYRGRSWFIGGDSKATTTTSILRHYSVDGLMGYSKGHHLPEICFGPICPPLQRRHETDQLNAAQSGALAMNLFNQWNYLRDMMLDDKTIDIRGSWKLMNIFIGSNDMCFSCTGLFYTSPEEYERTLRAVLEDVRRTMPKTFVSLVEVFRVSALHRLAESIPSCRGVHRLLPVQCSCGFLPSVLGGDKLRKKMDQVADKYNEAITRVAADFQARGDPDFAVVSIPAFSHVKEKELEADFLSTTDCFHPSAEAHQVMGALLWNNLISPRENKTSDMPPRSEWDHLIKCANKDTRLYVD